MVIRAKYNGQCSICGRRIRAGEEIEWSKANGAAHVACAKGEAQSTADAKTYDGPTWALGGGSGYGCTGWRKGDVIRASEKRRAEDSTCPEWLYILTAKRSYVREDGLSFGVGEDTGYLYEATARAATEAEYAPVAQRYAAEQEKKAAAAARAATLKEIETLCRAGECTSDAAAEMPAGVQIVAREGVHGSGREIIVLCEDGSVGWWCSGYYDDYRQSLMVTRDARAMEIARGLAGGAA